MNTKGLLAKGIKPEDNEHYLSGWCLLGTPQTDTSVQHQEQSFSAPKIRQINISTQKTSVQHIKSFSSTQQTSVQHTDAFYDLKWRVCLTDAFLWWTDVFWVELTGVLNWRFFLCGTEGFWGGKRVTPLCWTDVLNRGGPVLRDDTYGINSSKWDIIQFQQKV